MDLNAVLSSLNAFEKGDPELQHIAAQIAAAIQTSETSVLFVIQSLGDSLVNDNPETRGTGIYVLTQVLKHLPKNFLTSDQIEFLAGFLMDRLNDHHAVVPETLRALLVIIQFVNLPEGAAANILTAIFNEIPCQQQQQADRNVIYQVIEYLLIIRSAELKSMGIDFVFGVIAAIDTERDPRNLLHIFKWIPNFLNLVTLGPLADEMFEVLACYFPIDFKPGEITGNPITREELADALCPCLCYTPEFAIHCIPLILEKLDSTLQVAKMDSLKLLARSCLHFDSTAYCDAMNVIWTMLKNELFSAEDLDYEKQCLVTLELVMQKLSTLILINFDDLMRNVTDSVEGTLTENGKIFDCSAKFLLHVAISSRKAIVFFSKKIVPKLSIIYRKSTNVAHKIELLKLLVSFLKGYYKYCTEELKELAFIPVLAITASRQNDFNLRAAAFESLCNMTEYLKEELRNRCYKDLLTALILDQKCATGQVASFFKRLANIYSEETKTNILDKIVLSNNTEMQYYLTFLAEIIDVPFFTECVVNTLLTYAFEDLESFKITYAILGQTMEKHSDNVDVQHALFTSGIIQRTIESMIRYNVSTQEMLLQNAGNILKDVVGFQSDESQAEIARTSLETIDTVKSNESLYVTLLSGITERLKVQVDIKMDHVLHIAINKEDDFVQTAAAQLLANLLNKADDAVVKTNLKAIKLACNENYDEKIVNVSTVVAWVTKALCMRSHSEATDWTVMMVDLLEKNDASAHGFRIVMDEEYDCLSPKSHCQIRILYQQKFFTIVTNILSMQYTPDKENYLAGFGNLLLFAPKSAILLQFKKIVLLMIHGLEKSQDPQVLCNILFKLDYLIVSKESQFEEKMADFLPRIIQAASFEPSMDVRMIALKCLEHYTTAYPVYKLLPHKQLVVTKLGRCVDDPKRIVRKGAVQARVAWYLLDSP